MRERGERPEAPYRRPALMWWELLAYALILAIALALNALQFPKWVAAPPPSSLWHSWLGPYG